MKLAGSLSQYHSLTSVYSAQQVLENEAQVALSQGIALYELMKIAGDASFKALLTRWPNATDILIVCGKGNNGGDGFVVARLAYQAGFRVNVQVTCSIDQIKGDALLAYQAMTYEGMSDDVFHGDASNNNAVANIISNLNSFKGDVIVDALFGIGFKGELEKNIRQLVKAVNQHSAEVLSIDVPSGLCATKGFVSGNTIEEQAIMAESTITFIVYKQGLLTGGAANFVGKLQLASLGLNKAFTEQVTSLISYQRQVASGSIPKRLATSHKGDSGLLLTIGGGEGMPGAIRLTSEAALRCGAGLVSVCCAKENQSMVFYGRPELMISPCIADDLVNSSVFKKAKTFVVGPGLGLDNRARKLFHLIIQTSISENKTIVIDADALTLLSHYSMSDSFKLNYLSKTSNKWILTPHPKEAANLLGCNVEDVEADRFGAVCAIANKYKAICLLKGQGTLISNGRQVVINSSGNAGMASGGMGDVLSGVIGALVMPVIDDFNATCTAAYIHGAAADIMVGRNGQLGLLASDLFLPLQHLVNGRVR